MITDLSALTNLRITDFIIIISLNGILTAIVSWAMKALLELSIKHEYDKKLEDQKAGLNHQLEDYKFEFNKQLEDYRFDIKKREQAVRIAELFSLLRSTPQEAVDDKATDLTAINKIAWELSLWLPPAIVIALSESLANTDGAKDPKEILIEIRQLLLGKDDTLKASQIVHFT